MNFKFYSHPHVFTVNHKQPRHVCLSAVLSYLKTSEEWKERTDGLCNDNCGWENTRLKLINSQRAVKLRCLDSAYSVPTVSERNVTVTYRSDGTGFWFFDQNKLVGLCTQDCNLVIVCAVTSILPAYCAKNYKMAPAESTRAKAYHHEQLHRNPSVSYSRPIRTKEIPTLVLPYAYHDPSLTPT